MNVFLPVVRWLRLYVLPILFALFVAVLGTFFYLRAQSLMADQLRQRLQTTASVAATHFSVADIRAVRGADDEGSPAHRRLVQQLQRIREITPGVRYAYLVRETRDPNIVTFVADADEFRSIADIDLDGNGRVDDDEAPAVPGEEYDISGMAEFAAGFNGPSVDHDVTADRWGRLISGYAPVRDAGGRTIAVLGIDMNADEFTDIARSVFSPVAFMLVALAAMMLTYFSFSVVQRRRFESLKQLEVERTTLLDLATHQLGMPLATFRWWLEILRDKGKVEGDTEAFDQLQVGVDRMDHIIRSLQDAARLQAEKVSYHAELVDPVAFVDDVVESMKAAFDLKRQRVEVVHEGALPRVMIDPKLMTGVFSELLENARGYSPVDSVVTVRTSRVRSHVLIEVEDHGCGISTEQLSRMFQKFSRGKNAFANKPVGNGLGLYICKGIIERSGGTIGVRSKEGEGTTVSITLPVA